MTWAHKVLSGTRASVLFPHILTPGTVWSFIFPVSPSPVPTSERWVGRTLYPFISSWGRVRLALPS